MLCCAALIPALTACGGPGGEQGSGTSDCTITLASLEQAKQRLTGGTSILFFPEGTRSRSGELRPFKKGAFRMAQDLDLLLTRTGIQPLELLVAGGGSRNPVLMKELRRRCRGVAVGGSDRIGVPAEAREALVFALLAWWHANDHPGNAPAITGAAREARLGVMVSPA